MTTLFTFARTNLLTACRMTKINPNSKSKSLAKSLSTIMSSTVAAPRDPNTLSNYNHWKTKHTIADLAIDFKKQRLHGAVSCW